MAERGGEVAEYEDPVDTLIWLLLEAWSVYNAMRFSKDDRRKHAEPASDEDLSRTFGVAEDKIAEARTARSVRVTFADGRISGLATE